MKSRYTILVRDNKNGETLLSFDTNKVDYSLEAAPHVAALNNFEMPDFVDVGGHLTLEASVLLAPPETPVKEYDLDEETEEDCLTTHSYVNVMGIEVCGICGLKKNSL